MNARPRAWKALALLVLGLTVCRAHADDAISTDRPDFVESSEVVGRGRVQIETGWSSERSRGGGRSERVSSTPTLLRLGVNEVVELRVESDGLMRSRIQDASGTVWARGGADASLGLKWHTQDGDDAGNRPGMAWLLHVDIDSGSPAFRGQGLRPSLRGVAEWALDHEVSVGVMPGLLIDRNDDGQRFVAGIFAVTVGQQFTPKWRGFVELAGQQIARRRDGGSVVTFDAGATYLVSDALQLDLGLSRGLTRQSPDLQWGVGASFRF